MKPLLTILLLLIMGGCQKKYSAELQKKIDQEEVENYYKQQQDSENEYHTQRAKVINYDGCEYVYFYRERATWGSHKGNCKNPIHNK